MTVREVFKPIDRESFVHIGLRQEENLWRMTFKATASDIEKHLGKPAEAPVVQTVSFIPTRNNLVETKSAFKTFPVIRPNVVSPIWLFTLQMGQSKWISRPVSIYPTDAPGIWEITLPASTVNFVRSVFERIFKTKVEARIMKAFAGVKNPLPKKVEPAILRDKAWTPSFFWPKKETVN